MWQLLSSSHASQIRNILFAGGQVTESGTDAKLHVKGALRTLTPADTISTDWNDTDDVIVALQLTPSEQSQLVDSILKLRYERRSVSDRSRALSLRVVMCCAIPCSPRRIALLVNAPCFDWTSAVLHHQATGHLVPTVRTIMI